MSINAQELETIVRMVVERLRDSGLRDAGLRDSVRAVGATETTLPSVKSTDLAVASNVIAEKPAPGTLVVSDRLVTLKTIGDKLSGITSVQVPRKTVITPAVMDELRRRGIKLVRQVNGSNSIGSVAAANKSPTGLTGAVHLIASDEKYRVVRSVNKQQNIESVSASADELATAIKIASLSSQGQSPSQGQLLKAVWCASRPYAAQIACTKQAGLRFISLLQAADLHRAVQEASPEVIILDDSRWSGFQVAKLVQAWSQTVARGGN